MKSQRWKITSTEIQKDGQSLTVSFDDGDGSNMSTTLPSDKWQNTMHLNWLLEEERKINRWLNDRLKEETERRLRERLAPTISEEENDVTN